MATTSITTFVNKLLQVANSDPRINSFGYGPLYDIPDNIEYPMLWARTDSSHTLRYSDDGSYRVMEYRFILRVSDLVNNQRNVYNANGINSNNGLEISSDTEQILREILKYIETNDYFDGFNLRDDIDIIPFYNEDDGNANGHEAEITIRVQNINLCDTPLSQESNLDGGASGTVIDTSTTLNSISDVSIISLLDNQILVYNASTGFWQNETINLDDLGDVDTSGVKIGQSISWDGNNWIAATFSSASQIDRLTDITDVNPVGLTQSQLLTYNGTEWVNDNYFYDTNLGSLETPSTVGGIAAGTTAASLYGKSFTAMFDDLLFPTVLASITTNKSVTLTISGTTGNQEIGTTCNNTLTATFNQGTITDGDGSTTHPLVGSATLYTFTGQGISSTAQAGNTLAISFNVVEGDNDHDVVVNHAEGTETYFDNKGNAGSNLDASRVAGTTSDTNASPNITGYYRLFYSVSESSNPTTSAEVRAYSSELDTDNSFTLNTGNTNNKFIIVLPPGRTLSSVIDLDALNANITSNYVLQGTISVDDAGGTSRTYNLYVMDLASPYSSSHRHQMVFAG